MRYIDADAFIDKFKKALENQQHYGLYNHAKITQYVIKAIENEPTADVVPKSEEGAECPTCHGTGQIGTTDWLTKNISKKQLAEEKAKAIAEHEQYIKTEVAREIFEEVCEITKDHAIGDINDYRLYHRIAELKKKYTEDQT